MKFGSTALAKKTKERGGVWKGASEDGFLLFRGRGAEGKKKKGDGERKATVQQKEQRAAASLFSLLLYRGPAQPSVGAPRSSPQAWLLLAGAGLLTVVRRVRGGNRDGDVVSGRRRVVVPFAPDLLL